MFVIKTILEGDVMKTMRYVIVATVLLGVSPVLFGATGMLVYQLGDADDFTYNGPMLILTG